MLKIGKTYIAQRRKMDFSRRVTATVCGSLGWICILLRCDYDLNLLENIPIIKKKRKKTGVYIEFIRTELYMESSLLVFFVKDYLQIYYIILFY